MKFSLKIRMSPLLEKRVSFRDGPPCPHPACPSLGGSRSKRPFSLIEATYSLLYGLMIFVTMTACAPSDSPSVFHSGSSGDSGLPGNSGGYEDQCAEDNQCKEICNELFPSRKPKENCVELPGSTVEQMKEVFKILERPAREKLETLSFESLKQLLDISLKPLETAIDRMIPKDQKTFLVWLAENPETAKLISNADSDFKVMEGLLGTTKAVIVAALKKAIAKKDTFVEVALTESNEAALKWLHEFFGSRCNGKDYDKCIFKDYYCSIVSSLRGTRKPEKRYFGYEFFTKTLDAVLENHRPAAAPDWWEEDMKTKYLDDSWTSVCSVNF